MREILADAKSHKNTTAIVRLDMGEAGREPLAPQRQGV